MRILLSFLRPQIKDAFHANIKRSFAETTIGIATKRVRSLKIIFKTKTNQRRTVANADFKTVKSLDTFRPDFPGFRHTF